MTRAFAALFLFLALPAYAQEMDEIDVPKDAGTITRNFGAASLTYVTPDPAHRGAITITAASPGARPVTLTLEHDPAAHEFPISITPVEMDGGNRTLEFLVQRFSGGAHCCAVAQILDLVGDVWRVVPGGTWNGDHILPTDLDGDGEAEIAHGDNRFLYVFSCYACAAPPMRYFKLVDGTLADVSDSPLFRPRDEKLLPDYRISCAGHDNGACASYVAVARRLGRGDEAWAFMLANYDKTQDWGLSYCPLVMDEDGKCATATVTFKSYPDALKAFLQRLDDKRAAQP